MIKKDVHVATFRSFPMHFVIFFSKIKDFYNRDKIYSNVFLYNSNLQNTE